MRLRFWLMSNVGTNSIYPRRQAIRQGGNCLATTRGRTERRRRLMQCESWRIATHSTAVLEATAVRTARCRCPQDGNNDAVRRRRAAHQGPLPETGNHRPRVPRRERQPCRRVRRAPASSATNRWSEPSARRARIRHPRARATMVLQQRYAGRKGRETTSRHRQAA